MCLSDKKMDQQMVMDPLWETPLFRLVHADFCAWPGYLILRLKGPERSLAELAPPEAAAFGEALSRSARALENATRAERVYLLSFAEVDRQLHVHLLARTAEVEEAWRQASGKRHGAVDGPALFQWVRAAWPAGSRPPVGLELPQVLERLKQALAEDGPHV